MESTSIGRGNKEGGDYIGSCIKKEKETNMLRLPNSTSAFVQEILLCPYDRTLLIEIVKTQCKKLVDRRDESHR